MGRKKKIVELVEVGKIENLKIKEMNEMNINKDLQYEELRNKKKWERLIVKTYKQKIQIDFDDLYEKLQEKFSSEEEVKNIISELKIKIKDLEYLFKKQWQILKKFNLQEKIYREESKNLVDSERMKKDENYKEAIEKLTAAHVGGFEPASIIINKIMVKIQQKFDISEEIMDELREINFDFYFKKDARENKTEYLSEDKLLKKRHEDQVGTLEKFIKVNFLVPAKENIKYRDRDRGYDSMPNYYQNKQELKRYEKELEMKAGKGAYSYIFEEANEEDFIEKKFENPLSEIKWQSTNSHEMEKSSSIYDHPNSSSSNYNYNYNNNNNKSHFNYSNFHDALNNRVDNENINIDSFSQNDIQMQNNMNMSDGILSSRFDSYLKVKDFLRVTDHDNICKFKDKVVQDMKEKAIYNKELYEDVMRNQNSIYKSKILNDLYTKLTLFSKLTDFEIQILIYLSHVAVRDLVQAKNFNRTYDGMVNPEELIDFLKRFKIEIQNNSVLIDGKLTGNCLNEGSNNKDNFNLYQTNNNSNYSYINSGYAEDGKDE